MLVQFEEDLQRSVETLRDGGVILYPTDTIWGLGCDATNEAAVRKIFDIKKRPDSKSVIILMAGEKDILKYIASPDLAVFSFLEEQQRPTTVIFPGALGLAPGVIAEDGSVAVRLVKDDFCRHLIKRLGRPLVSTSANISGQPAPANFSEVSNEVKENASYIVRWRQDDESKAQPSRIIRWIGNGDYTIIRD